MRILRVKAVNLEVAIAALREAGYEADRAVRVPMSETVYQQWSYMDAGEEADKLVEEDLRGMAAIETDASGRKFHKLMERLKAEGKAVE